VIEREAAEEQGRILHKAADASPLRQVRSELRRRADEWFAALSLCEEAGDDYEIELAGSVAPGDRVVALVATPYSDGKDRESVPVLRVLHRDGQTSLHLAANSNGREVYLNFAGPSSPVVVRS
jgi:hypothetical protein